MEMDEENITIGLEDFHIVLCDEPIVVRFVEEGACQFIYFLIRQSVIQLYRFHSSIPDMLASTL